MEYPDSSKELDAIMLEYVSTGGRDEHGLALINSFLEKYPYHSEGLAFKSTLYIYMGNYTEAKAVLDVIEKVDKWNISYLWDYSELCFEQLDTEGALNNAGHAIKSLLDRLDSEIDNMLYYMYDEKEKRDNFRLKLLDMITLYINGKSTDLEIKHIYDGSKK